MERANLKIFTRISFFTALATTIAIPTSIYITPEISGKNVESILTSFVLLAFLASIISIPLSIVSMFSNENLVKRIFSLVVNLLPIIFFVYALIVEIVDEFFKSAP